MKVLTFPKDSNPYQDLLHTALLKEDIKIDYLLFWTNSFTLNLLEIFPLLLIRRIKGYKIFHLHWLTKFQFPINNKFFRNKFFRLLFTLYLIILLVYLKTLGYKIVWTMHNILPHEKIFFNDVFITKFIINFANNVIVHNQYALIQIEKLRIPTNKISVIPIGPYKLAETKAKLTQRNARDKIRLSNDNLVFIFFGLIREYKGIDNLLFAYEKYYQFNKNSNLLIIGKSNDKNITKIIKKYQEKFPSIISELEYVSDEKLLNYLIASDVTVLPYKKVTTSSTAMLSFEYGLPIIAPRVGPFLDYSNELGYFYSKNTSNFLFKAMKEVKKNKEFKIKVNNVLEYVKRFSWKNIALLTKKVYLTK